MNRAIRTLLAGAVLASAVATSPASAAAFGTLTYLEPSGSAGALDSIPVWMRLTIDASSEPLVVDSSLDFYGINPADVPTDWVSFDNAFISTFFLCSGTFTASCTDGPPYRFEFNTSGPDAINFKDPTNIPAGATRDYLFGTFVPSSGPAAAGTYTFFNTGVTLNLNGRKHELDEEGNPKVDEFGDPIQVAAELSFNVAESCATSEASCAFTRTVVAAIPEPETYAMMLAGLGLVGLAAARRRRASVKLRS
jgi:hypothetical protein